MVKAGDKYPEKFYWGVSEIHHSVILDDERKFFLNEVVTITTKTGRKVRGRIDCISELSVDIVRRHQDDTTVKLKDILEISY